MFALLSIDLFFRIGRYVLVSFGVLFFVLVFGVLFSCVIVGTVDDDEMEEFFAMNDRKFMAHWYDQEEEVHVDGPIYASSEEEAKNIAYRRYNGKPPAPMLWLEEIGR